MAATPGMAFLIESIRTAVSGLYVPQVSRKMTLPLRGMRPEAPFNQRPVAASQNGRFLNCPALQGIYPPRAVYLTLPRRGRLMDGYSSGCSPGNCRMIEELSRNRVPTRAVMQASGPLAARREGIHAASNTTTTNRVIAAPIAMGSFSGTLKSRAASAFVAQKE